MEDRTQEGESLERFIRGLGAAPALFEQEKQVLTMVLQKK
jgi:hypothetical protein